MTASHQPTKFELRARIAAGIRHHGASDPAVIALQRELRELVVTEYVEHVVSSAPPLTDAQRRRIAALLLTAPTSDVEGAA